MLGHGEFAHVIFDNAGVPASCRLGEENDGWNVMVKALNFERVGPPRFITPHQRLDQLADYARGTERDGQPLFADPVVRQRFAALKIEAEVARLLYYQAVSAAHRGEDFTLAASLSMVSETTANQRVASFALELQGDLADAAPGVAWAPFEGRLGGEWMASLTKTIAGGTTEIQKNVIATRGLGLPR
jgi:hypothetical protein